jgi:membrane protease subunit HflC
MKNIAITVLLLVVILVLAVTFISFQVRETEVVLVTTFGKPTKQITEPGFRLKWPPPIQNIQRFDSRLRVDQADLTETTTKGNIPIIIDTYIVWKIAEPLKFYNTLGTVKEAQNKLISRLNDTQNSVVGQYAFSDFVNSDPNKIKIAQVQQDMLEKIRQPVLESYGIEIRDIGIKQLKISEDTTKKVFDRMIAERNRRTQDIITAGQAEADKIVQDAEAKNKELTAVVEGRAQEIRAEGDSEAAKFYRMLEGNPQLAIFLRDLEAFKSIFDNKTTFVISADQQPFTLLKEIPKIEGVKGTDK